MTTKKPIFWIIAGTTEGRKLVETLRHRDVILYVSLATEYGLSLLDNYENVHPWAARLSQEEMQMFLEKNKPDCVIDTTHPYAQKVTTDIKRACLASSTPYLRILRPPSETKDLIYASDTRQAAKILGEMEGKAFLTCGSKEIEAFTCIQDFAEKLIVRVLPAPDSLNKCLSLGFKNSNIICMQGPFSKEMNIAMLKAAGAATMVTKDSGEIGGYPEKVAAARELGITVIVIGRPVEEQEGLTFTQVLQKLEEDYKIDTNTTEQQTPVNTKKDIHRQADTSYFPVFISLQNKKVKVFGGGKIAARRVAVLAEFGAFIEVIAPQISEEIKENKAVQNITVRPYHKEDCYGSDLVIAATNDRMVNRQIAVECQQQHILVSVADDKALCTFYFPAVVKRENMVIGITSSGHDHSRVKKTAQKIQQGLDQILS